VHLNRVAANPLSIRDPHARPTKLAELVGSIQEFGQIQPCAVVTYDAFVAVFPERADEVKGADFVQVTGGRRRAALTAAQIPTMDIVTRDVLAVNRAVFVAATAAENIDRDDYDPIEEATQLQVLVQECGSAKDAAAQLRRSAGWATQRLNLLKLVSEVQKALRAGEVPLREVRELHRKPDDEQVTWLQQWREEILAREAPEQDDAEEPAEPKPAPRPRRSRVATAIDRLGGTPVKIAESLRSELPAAEVRALAEALLRDLDANGDEYASTSEVAAPQ
jgi:ParB family chromosome partitioning protein